jgi:hypothetical protein
MKPPYPPQAEQRCGNCLYYWRPECRRRSPDWQWGGSWPQPMSTDWCGEWAPQEVPQ